MNVKLEWIVLVVEVEGVDRSFSTLSDVLLVSLERLTVEKGIADEGVRSEIGEHGSYGTSTVGVEADLLVINGVDSVELLFAKEIDIVIGGAIVADALTFVGEVGVNLDSFVKMCMRNGKGTRNGVLLGPFRRSSGAKSSESNCNYCNNEQ